MAVGDFQAPWEPLNLAYKCKTLKTVLIRRSPGVRDALSTKPSRRNLKMWGIQKGMAQLSPFWGISPKADPAARCPSPHCRFLLLMSGEFPSAFVLHQPLIKTLPLIAPDKVQQGWMHFQFPFFHSFNWEKRWDGDPAPRAAEGFGVRWVPSAVSCFPRPPKKGVKPPQPWALQTAALGWGGSDAPCPAWGSYSLLLS